MSNCSNENCIFCKIINNEIPSYKIYENNDLLVILDLFPVDKGHCLIITKKHFDNFRDVTPKFLHEATDIAKNIINRIENKFGAKDFNLVTNIGKNAGQEVFHFHWHIIPRYEYKNKPVPRLKFSKEEFEEQAKELSTN